MTPAFNHRDAILRLGRGSWVKAISAVENDWSGEEGDILPPGTVISVNFAYDHSGSGFYGEADVSGVLRRAHILGSQFHLIEIIEAVEPPPVEPGAYADDGMDCDDF